MEADGWRVAEALKSDLLHVNGRVVEDKLSWKIVKARRLGIEFYDDYLEGLSSNLPDLWKHLESASWVLKGSKLHRCIAGVKNLQCLINGLVRAASLQCHFAGTQFDHRDERLRSRCKRMAHQSNLQALGRINLFVIEVDELWLLDRAEQRLTAGLLAAVRLGQVQFLRNLLRRL